MFNPEEPRQDLILTHETRFLCETKTMIESNAPLADIFAHIENKSLGFGSYLVERLCGRMILNWRRLHLLNPKILAEFLCLKITSIPNMHLKQAEVATYFGDFERAESLYVATDCRLECSNSSRAHVK